MERENRSTLERVDFVPMRRISVLSHLSFRKFEVNQDLMTDKQEIREGGGRVELSLFTCEATT